MVSFLDRIRAAQTDWLAGRYGDGGRPAVVFHPVQLPDFEREIAELENLLGTVPRTDGGGDSEFNSMRLYVCPHLWGPCVVDSRGLLALKMVGARQI